MIRRRTLAEALPSRRAVVKPQFRGHVTDLIVPEAGGLPRPQAFLVEQDPHWTLPVHFHQEHQFQVFVRGSGSFGTRPLPPLAVHYASPHAGYGPLVSGSDGLAYLTLRATGDTGAWYLPERARDILRVPKHQAHGAPSQRSRDGAIASLPAAVHETLIAPTDGGPGAWLLRLPAAAAAPAPGGPDGGGRFVVLTEGTLALQGSLLDALATAWIPAGESLDLCAGPGGAELVVVRFPKEAGCSFIEAHDLPASP